MQNRGIIDRHNLLGSFNDYINDPIKVYEHSVGGLADLLFTPYFDHKRW